MVVLIAVLVLSAGAASAAYIVELDAGDRMTVDECWDDGDRVHLVRDGTDLSVPRSRVHSFREVGSLRPPTAVPPLRRPIAGR